MSQQQLITPQSSARAEAQEYKLSLSGRSMSALTYDPKSGKIYLGDGRDYLEKDDWLVDVENYKKSKVLGAAGELDKANALKVFSQPYIGMVETFARIEKVLDSTHTPYQKVFGASGIEATTQYENVRRTGDLLTTVTGKEYLLEEFQAINLAEEVRKDALKFKYFRRISDQALVQRELGDDDIPHNVRAYFTDGEKEIFADAVSIHTSMRDTKNNEFDVIQQIVQDFPGAFLKAKNDKVLEIINAKPGTNQGDWNATSGNFYDVKAAEQIQEAEKAVRPYGGPLVVGMNSDTWRLYVDNFGGSKDPKPSNISTADASMKKGTLQGNPSTTYHIDDGITSESYIMVALRAYMKLFRGQVIQSSVKDERTAGQNEQRFYFDFNGVEETEPDAFLRGTTVGS